MQLSSRQRTKNLLRAQMADDALDLVRDREFDDVTVDELAQHLGVSRATFFRYFQVKEEIVLAALDDNAADFHEILRTLQPVEDRSPWVLLYRVFRPVGDLTLRDPSRLRLRLRLVAENPSIAGRLEFRRQEQRARLTEALAQHLGDRLLATRLAYVGIAALNLTWSEWAADDNADFGALLAGVVTDVSGLPKSELV